MSNQQVNINVNTAQAEQDLADLAKTVNDFLSGRGQASGKKVRLLDLSADKAELEDLKKKFVEVINLNSTIRAPMNMAGQGVGNRPSIPSQISPLPGESSKDLERRITAATARLLQHHFNSSKSAVPNGLTPQDLLPGRNGPAAPGQLSPVASAIGSIARQISPLLGSAGGAVGQAASGGAAGFAGRGLAGFAGGGMAGMAAGAGIGLLGYGLYKGASAVNEGLDREKVLATDIDKFKRSLGGTSESFDRLRDQSRMIGDAFNLTYLESRNISTEFAKIAKSNLGAIDQASEGVGMAQAVGADEAQGSGFMAHLRKDQSIGDKKSDARLMAIQFAEALRRTGSTLNAGELMTAIQGFSGDTARRGLSAPNVEGYAGLLSAIVGRKIPGLDVNGAGSLIGRADSSFQGGGAAGQSSNTLQYMAFGGDKIGLMGAQMREAAGMFASNDSVFGNKDSPVNQYTGGSMLKHKGSSSGLEDVIGMIKANAGGNKELEIMTLARHLKLNPNEAATFLNMQGTGQLGGMLGLASQYKGVDLGKMSSAGYTTLADIHGANGDAGKLGLVRDGLSARSGLSKDQSAQLAAMKGLGGSDLQDALVKFSTTMEREKTDGEQIKTAAVKTANATDRLASLLIPASIITNNLLAEMVRAAAPGSPYLKDLEARKFKDRVALSSDAIKSGGVDAETLADLNGDYTRDLRRDMKRSSGITSASRMAVLEKQYRQMGDKMVTPRDVHDIFPPGEIDAMKKRVDAEPNTAAGIPANNDANNAVNEAAAKHGINPDYLRGLAQLETGMGKKSIKGGGQDTKNLFNVKGNAANGIQAYDKAEGSNDYYKKYSDYGESADAAASLISRKYPDAKSAKTPQDFATALKNGGYATDPNYIKKLSGVITETTAKIPPNDPAKAAANAAEAQRLHVSLGKQESTVTVILAPTPGSGQQPQTVTSSGTSKSQPSGSISTDARKYRP